MTSIAFVILYYRAGAHSLTRTLEACRLQSPSISEILVVDNGSDDGVVDGVAQDGGFRTLALQDNLGYSGGMNAGRRALTSSPGMIIFLTHETVLAPHCAGELAWALDDGALAAGPRLVLPSGEIWSVGGQSTWSGRARHRVTLERDGGARVLPCQWIDGAAIAMRPETFDAVGGFDDSYFLYWEDFDIGMRLSSRGTVVCCTAAVATQSTALTPPYLASRGRIRTWVKHRRYGRVLLSVLDLMFRSLVRYARRRDTPSLTRLRMEGAGIVDALIGRLDTGRMMWRPPGPVRPAGPRTSSPRPPSGRRSPAGSRAPDRG